MCLGLKRLIIFHGSRALLAAAVSFSPPLCCSPKKHTHPFTSVSKSVHPAPHTDKFQGGLELSFHPSKPWGQWAVVGTGQAWSGPQLCLGEVAASPEHQGKWYSPIPGSPVERMPIRLRLCDSEAAFIPPLQHSMTSCSHCDPRGCTWQQQPASPPLGGSGRPSFLLCPRGPSPGLAVSVLVLWAGLSGVVHFPPGQEQAQDP